MNLPLESKTALITGASKGIGKGIALELARAGANVAVNYNADRTGAEATVAEIRGMGREAFAVQANVGVAADVERMFGQALEAFPRLDILVNNAGVGVFKPVDQLSVEDWDSTIQTNLSGVFYCCHEAIPLMRKRGGGYIFNISSLAGVNPMPTGAAYNASKFGLNGFSEAMMQDVRYDGIRVSYLMPGSVDTDFAAAPGSKARESWKLTGEDVAKAVVDLYKFPTTALASRIEMRPSQPPRKK